MDLEKNNIDETEASQDFENVEEVETVSENTIDDLETPVEVDAEDAEPVEVVEEKKPMSASSVAAISVLITLIVCCAAAFGVYKKYYNPYNNNKYAPDISSVAEQNNQTVAEFIEEWKMPADMRADTLVSVAEYYIPASKMAEMYGMDFESLKKAVGVDAEITEDMLWGDVEKLMKAEQDAKKAAETDEGAQDNAPADGAENADNADNATSENTSDAE